MIFFGYFFQVFSVFSVTDNIETPIGMDRLKFFPYAQQPVYSFVSITEEYFVLYRKISFQEFGMSEGWGWHIICGHYGWR